MSSAIVSTGAAVFADTLSALGVPGGATVAEVTNRIIERKRAAGRETLLAELEEGKHGKVTFLEDDVDPLFDIIHRYCKAVEDGVARTNLRLLSQIIAGQKVLQGRLDAGAFRKWAFVLEDLNDNDLVVIGTVIRVKRQREEGIWITAKEELSERHGINGEIADAIAASLSRTGLLIPVSAWGGLIYQPSHWIDEIAELTDVEATGS